MIRVGQVVAAFGIQGAVKVVPLTDFEDRFEPGAELHLDGREERVEWSRRSPSGVVLKLAGLDSRTLAELHRGHYLEVPEESLRKLPPGAWYHHDLVGLRVVSAGGTDLGTLTSVMSRPANDVWVAEREGIEHLIPATRDALVEVDVAGGRVVIADWLLHIEEA